MADGRILETFLDLDFEDLDWTLHKARPGIDLIREINADRRRIGLNPVNTEAEVAIARWTD